jgi:hypothetical protein
MLRRDIQQEAITPSSASCVRLLRASPYGARRGISSPANEQPWRLKWLFAVVASSQVLASLPAHATCPVEVKLLLPVAAEQAVIASLGFGKETRTRVYLFDTGALELLSQGVILRVREGAKNDLTVKVRRPQEKHDFLSGEGFPCEVDRTRSEANTSYAVSQKSQVMNVPKNGEDFSELLNASQMRLLQEARVVIDWTRVKRMASIDSTSWETPAQSPSGSLALELWAWKAGSLLELSTKVAPEAATWKLAELESLLKTNNLALSSDQVTKTSAVLKSLADPTSRPR